MPIYFLTCYKEIHQMLHEIQLSFLAVKHCVHTVTILLYLSQPPANVVPMRISFNRIHRFLHKLIKVLDGVDDIWNAKKLGKFAEVIAFQL